ncbi:MAG: polyprenyl synthetase family protein [Peptococcales bacterium]|jgi:heptaprenyl diphosphate synthase
MKKTLMFNEIKTELENVEKFLTEYVNFSHSELRNSSQHILKAGGKRIRPAFVLLSGKVFNPKGTTDLIPFAAAVELIHMASLVHDDVIDKADLRRGQPTIRVLQGNKFSLHCGDYLLAHAIKLIKPDKNKEIANLLAKISVEMCQGEIQQLLTVFNTNQTIKDYFYRIKRKTALLIAASCKIGAIATNAPIEGVNALYRYGYNLGMAFQIKDDVLDIAGNSDIIGKPAGSDLAQGIITLPTIYALNCSGKDSSRLRDLINNRFVTKEEQLVEAIDIVRKSNGLEKSLDISQKFIAKAKNQLSFLPKGPMKTNLMKLADYINERKF